MEEIPGARKQEVFLAEKSPLKDAYELLGAKTPLELSQLYSEKDQELMKARAWDYGNPDLITNKIKELLESTDNSGLTQDEKMWRRQILWFWYHHAISCAIGRYKDQTAAQQYSEQALKFQDADHPNKITKLFYFLTRDDISNAEAWAQAITSDERETADYLIQAYKHGKFYSDQF